MPNVAEPSRTGGKAVLLRLVLRTQPRSAASRFLVVMLDAPSCWSLAALALAALKR